MKCDAIVDGDISGRHEMVNAFECTIVLLNHLMLPLMACSVVQVGTLGVGIDSLVAPVPSI